MVRKTLITSREFCNYKYSFYLTNKSDDIAFKNLTLFNVIPSNIKGNLQNLAIITTVNVFQIFKIISRIMQFITVPPQNVDPQLISNITYKKSLNQCFQTSYEVLYYTVTPFFFSEQTSHFRPCADESGRKPKNNQTVNYILRKVLGKLSMAGRKYFAIINLVCFNKEFLCPYFQSMYHVQ